MCIGLEKFSVEKHAEGGISMLEFLGRIFGGSEGSKNKAKERLRLVLVHDRASLSPGLVAALKEDLIEVISKYMVIEEEGLEVSFDEGEDSAALIANIPIKSVKRKAT